MKNTRSYTNRTPKIGSHGKDYAVFRVHGPLRTMHLADVATGHEAKTMMAELAAFTKNMEHVDAAFVIVRRSTGRIFDQVNVGQVL